MGQKNGDFYNHSLGCFPAALPDSGRDGQGQLQAYKHAYRYLPAWRLHDHYSLTSSCAFHCEWMDLHHLLGMHLPFDPNTITIRRPSLG